MATYPSFFDEVRAITMYDPLAEFLGTSERGIIEYRYVDAVKLAGHSCPTVAGAYLMTLKALTHLYGESMPERGAIRVAFHGDITAGVTGVIANVVGLITGATEENGFKGIGGRFDRRHLLSFGADIGGDIRFTRVDTDENVDVTYRADQVAFAPEMAALMPRVQANRATMDEQNGFRALWQDRVRRILIDNMDNQKMIILSPREKLRAR